MQFETVHLGGLRVRHLEFSERIQHDLRDDQTCVLLVVGGNDVPRSMISACRMKAIRVDLYVLLPIFPLVNVGGAELPVLVWLIDALKESLSLLFARKVEEYFDNARPGAMKMLFQIHD